ncbi:hypothetical protein MMC28_002743 [Mycoblastus sanguinarius]|nr:hypothetical protein [Mycoblastus sanguinarius]
MAIRFRAAQQINEIDPSIGPLPDIPYSAVPTPIATLFPGDSNPYSIVSAPPVLSSTISTPTSAALATTQSSATTHSRASSTPTPAPSHELSPGKLTAAIVVPIAFLAILIPILVLWFLDHRRKVASRTYASQRSSREAMIQKKPPRPAASRPARTPKRNTEQIPDSQVRDSLGLFNFELSSPTSAGASTPGRFSIARALELHRSQASVIYPTSRPPTRGSETDAPMEYVRPFSPLFENQRPRTNIYDPPPPYTSPKLNQTSHFAPLERIGTMHQANRSVGALQNNNTALDVQPQPTPYASSETLQRPNTYGRVRTRSPSPVSPTHVSPRNSSSLNSPFSQPNFDRLSDVSGMSFDPSPWELDHSQHSHGHSIISPVDKDDIATIHPHVI